MEFKIDAIIATNTTIARDAVQELEFGKEAGGLSGAPVRQSSTEVVRSLKGYLGAAIPIIGVGGIMTSKDAQEKLAAGASLVQIYSGLIYRGPKLISECAAALKGH